MKNRIRTIVALIGFATIAISSNAALQPGQAVFGHVNSIQSVVTQEFDNVFMEWTMTNNYVKAETDPLFNSWLSTYNWSQYLKSESDPMFNEMFGANTLNVTNEQVKFSTTADKITIGSTTLSDLLDITGKGEMNKIEKITLNSSEEFVAVDESTKTVNITNVATKTELDGKLDATNGVAFADLKVYPENGIVGSTHLILTHESMSIGNTSWVEYKQNGITYNTDLYEFSSESNGIARLKDIPVIPTIATNGVDVAVTDNKINIAIPDVPIKSVTTNGTEFSVREGVVTIPLDEYVRLKDLQEGITFDNLSATNLTINGKQVSVEGHKHVVEDITDLKGLWSIPGADVAASNAIDKIEHAQNMQ